MAIKNSLTRVLTLFMQEIMQIGIIKVVKTINKMEIPSIPSLYFIKLLIHVASSTNWNSVASLSKEYQRNNESRRFEKLVKSETYMALLFFWSFDKRIKIEPSRGKNIIVDNIGKFI